MAKSKYHVITIKSCRLHPGAGWVVVDNEGNQWDSNGPEDPIIVRYNNNNI